MPAPHRLSVSDVLHDVAKEVGDLEDPLSVDIDSLAAAAEPLVSVKNAALVQATPQRPQSGDEAIINLAAVSDVV